MKLFLRSLLILLFPLLLMGASPSSQDQPEAAPPEPRRPEEVTIISSGTIKEILNSDIILMDNDKRYRVENIRVPPFEETKALDKLNEEFLNKKVDVYTYHDPEKRIDRYGMPLAHIVREDGTWMQEYLIANGLAWVFTSEESQKLLPSLRKAEEIARRQQAGFWGNSLYAIKTPENVGDFLNSFQIVEGKIYDVSEGQSTIFFNFAQDRLKDFTITLQKKNIRLFPPQDGRNYNPQDWKNRMIRIRGWVEKKNGPMIQLTHPAQIELLPEPK